MKKIDTLLKKHAALAYFALTFLFTWGSIFLVVGSVGFPIPAEKIEAAGPLVYAGMLVGPGLAGILMIGLVDGRAGYRELFSRLGKWRVGLRWYAAALLTVPVLIMMILGLLSRTSPEFLPAITTAEDKVSLLVTGLVMGLVVGLFEEIGWTGFVVPRLRERYGLLPVGLIVGLLWGLWHYPPFSASGGHSGSLSPVLYLGVLLFSFLPAYRVLLVWVYDRTGSLLVTVLMHAPLSASQLILVPPTLSGARLVTYDLVFALALWVLVFAALATRSKPGTVPVLESRAA